MASLFTQNKTLKQNETLSQSSQISTCIAFPIPLCCWKGKLFGLWIVNTLSHHQALAAVDVSVLQEAGEW